VLLPVILDVSKFYDEERYRKLIESGAKYNYTKELDEPISVSGSLSPCDSKAEKLTIIFDNLKTTKYSIKTNFRMVDISRICGT
jgi:hypothetical protein